MRAIWAIIPLKQLRHAKQRLSPLLSVEERRQLGLAMLEDVLRALGQTRGLSGIMLVTGDQDACDLGRRFGARILPETGSDGLNPAVTRAANLLAQEGMDGALILHGDVPLADPREIESLLGALQTAPAIAIAPDGARQGTNGMALSPPDAISFHYGLNSFAAHQQQAQRRNITPRILDLPSLALDMDAPEDLLRLTHCPGQSCTQILLRQMDLESRTQSAAAKVR
ncbi:unnamed protein product [Phaeothamnion confervicola]